MYFEVIVAIIIVVQEYSNFYVKKLGIIDFKY